MEQLIEDVMASAGVGRWAARAAIGHILMFLRDQAPESHVRLYIENTPAAHQAIEAAHATNDGGFTSALAAMRSFRGEGEWNFLALMGKLKNLGMNDAQVDSALREVLSHAGTLIGPEGVEQMRVQTPSVSQFV